jgi:NADH dehydrogenase FAD-containing subunit
VLRRRGAELKTSTPVQAIEPGGLRWKDGSIKADTIVLAAGVVPSAVAAAAALERDRRGRIVTDATMRSVSHPNVWAIGDCAAVGHASAHRARLDGIALLPPGADESRLVA